MTENRFKKLREDFEFKENGYRITMKELSDIFQKRGYSSLTHIAIRKLETGKRDLKNIDEVIAYADFFNVTADYLLGIRNNAIVDENIAMIGKTTGLSDDAIQIFKQMSETERNTFNKLATEDGLLRLLLLELWNYANNSTYVDIKIYNHITENTKQITDKKEVDNIMKYQAIDVFNMVLYFIKKAFSDSVSQAADDKLNLLKLKIELEKKLGLKENT